MAWGARQLVIGVGGAIVMYLVVAGAIVIPLLSRYEEKSPEVLAGSMAATLVWQAGVLGLLFLLLRRYGGVLSLLGARRPDLEPPDWYTRLGAGRRVWVVIVAVIGSLAARVALVVYVGIALLLDYDFLLPEDQIPSEVFEHIGVQVLAGFSIVLVAPVVEELFFRGFLFAGLARLISLYPAALVSSLIFAVLHAQSGLIIPFTLIGLLLAFLYYRTKSIYVPMGVHFFFNLVSFVGLVFFADMGGT